MTIPSCLTLTAEQKKLADDFAKSVGPLPRRYGEEECSSMSRFFFKVQDTSIGFNLSMHDEVTGRSASLLTQEDIDNM